jgi:putative PIN family toxin of toxin-antitoxin system
MIKVVIDTNVIISAALSPLGNPSKIVELISSNENIQLYYSTEVISEYMEVLSRPRFNIAADEQARYLEKIKEKGVQISPTTSSIALPDESDRVFYDAAREVGAILITGNTKHYPNEPFVMTPAEFICKKYGQ